MATVIDFRTRQAAGEPPAPLVRSDLLRAIEEPREFKPPRTTPSNARNRYDAAFKGYMKKRAAQHTGELGSAISDSTYWPLSDSGRKDAVRWVIAEINRIADEAISTTPELHPPSPDAAVSDDPHIGWLVEYHAAYAKAAAIEGDDERLMDAAYAVANRIEDRILDARPNTPAGAAAQLMTLVEIMHGGFSVDSTVTRPVLRRAAELLPVPNWRDRVVFDETPPAGGGGA